jgi:hypothetical protein
MNMAAWRKFPQHNYMYVLLTLYSLQLYVSRDNMLITFIDGATTTTFELLVMIKSCH